MTAPFEHRILLVDDNEVVRETLCALLEDDGFEVSAVGSLGEARTALASYVYAAILLDLNLGGEHGLELVPELRSHLPAAPIIVLSGEPTGASIADVEASLPKDIEFEQLISLLEDLGVTRPKSAPERAPLPDSHGPSTPAPELAEVFLRHAPGQLRAVEEAETAEALRQHAHCLKGSAIVLGLSDLLRVLEELEREATNGSLETAIEMKDRLKREFQAAENWLRNSVEVAL